MKSKIETITGNIIATILTLIVVYAIFISFFNLLFGDIKRFPMYGNRGNSYIYDNYN